MKTGDFNTAWVRAGGASDTAAPVVFQNMETGEIFDIESIQYQPQSSDDGGNPTSTGGTTFIRGKAH